MNDVYRKQKELYEQQYAAQQQLAERQAQENQQKLSEQLAKQRADYVKQQEALLTKNVNPGRNLLNSLVNRGLATSGLLQLGDTQQKMAQGQTLSELARQNNEFQQQAMNAQQGITNSLQDALRQASLDYQGKLVSSDMSQMDRTQQQKEQQLQSFLNAFSMMKGDGELTQEDRNLLASMYQQTYGTDLVQDTTGKTLTETLGSLGASNIGDLGDVKLNEKVDWGMVGAGAGTGAAVGTGILPGLGTGIGTGVGGLGMLIKESNLFGVGNQPVSYKIGGKTQQFANINEAVSAIQNMYAGKPHADKIKVVAATNWLGNKSGDIRFKVGNTEFKTYNEAVKYINTYGG